MGLKPKVTYADYDSIIEKVEIPLSTSTEIMEITTVSTPTDTNNDAIPDVVVKTVKITMTDGTNIIEHQFNIDEMQDFIELLQNITRQIME